MKKKIIFSCLASMFFCFNSDSLAFDNTIIKNENLDFLDFNKVYNLSENINYELPSITSELNNIKKLDYQAELLDYSKNSYNYLIFYDAKYNDKINELFRIKLNKSGKGTINNEKVLAKLKNNTRLTMKVMSFKVDNKGNFSDIRYSKQSQYYFTPKTINLVINENGKEVYSEKLKLNQEVKNDKIVLKPSDIQKYKNDKFYTYDKAQVTIDNNKNILKNLNIEIPYESQKLTVNLNKKEENWKTITVKYPYYYKDKDKYYSVKKDTTLAEFLKTNELPLNFDNDENYEFLGYYLDNKVIKDSLSNKISSNININAVFNTKIILDNEDTTKEIYLKTGDTLASIDNNFFVKDKYQIEDYNIIDIKTNEKIKTTKILKNEDIDRSVIIKANYKANTNKISVRQDDYNKRFGKVADSIKDIDVTWKQTDKIGVLLTELKSKIKANSGYEVLFRVNKEIVDENSYIDKDIVLEIYFKKIEEDWLTVKFIGKGIDKFLSDGQEVLAGNRIDSNINLPTATGETEREFLGWKVNANNVTIIKNSKKMIVSNKVLFSTEEVGSIITEKGQNLEFTATYRNIFNISFEETSGGKVVLAKNNTNILKVDENDTIGEALNNNRLIPIPKTNYTLSHFIANKNVMIKRDGKIVEIFSGQKIGETDLMSLLPQSDLVIKPIFYFENYTLSFEETMDGSLLYDVNKVLGLDPQKSENIVRILGPLYYLR